MSRPNAAAYLRKISNLTVSIMERGQFSIIVTRKYGEKVFKEFPTHKAIHKSKKATATFLTTSSLSSLGRKAYRDMNPKAGMLKMTVGKASFRIIWKDSENTYFSNGLF